MTPAEVIAHFRSQVDDDALPYLWSDDEALRYLVDAQDMLVRSMGGIADVTVASASAGTTRLADLDLAVGDPYTAISPYVLRVRSARLLTAAKDVVIANEGDLLKVRERDYGFVRTLTFDDGATGPVDYGVLGVRENFVRWFKVPDTADTCRMHVQRLPYPRLPSAYAALTSTTTLEVVVEHRIHLVDWMKHKAYLKADAEVNNPKASEASKAAFLAYADQARRERERRQYKPREVHYGGL